MASLRLRVALFALIGAPLLAQESWSDDLESYPPGTPIEGVGGWMGWNGSQDQRSKVSATKFHTGAQSLRVATGADTVHELSGPIAGRWTVTAWVFVPAAGLNKAAFVLLNRYEVGGPKRWAGQLIFDMTNEVLQCWDGTFNPIELPLVTDQWVELRYEIDLDADWADVHYDGQHLAGYVWSAGITGDETSGRRAIEAVDLVNDPTAGGAPVFFDDFSVQYRGGGQVGQSYCDPAVVNSTGLPASISAFGQAHSAGVQPLRLFGRQLPPHAPAVLLVSRGEDLLPGAFGGQGTLCLGGPLGSYALAYADAAGVLSVDVDTELLPLAGGWKVRPGETWNFQWLYRDRNPGATTNLSDAVAVSFL